MAGRKKFVLTAGGTGGHLFPAQALAEQLARRGHGLALMTDRRGAQFGQRFPDAEIVTVEAASPAGGIGQKLRSAVRMGRGCMQALTALRRLAPAAVIGFGGYASLPALWAAGRQRRPIVLHEQNAFAGRANRLFAGRAAAVGLSFAATGGLERFGDTRTVVVGNPVRDAILTLRDAPYEGPGHDGPLNLFVFGGSQGAAVFAETVPEALGGLPERLRSRLSVTQQVRPENMDAARAAYAAAGMEARLEPFFEDMAALLGRAHLVLSRAGASTVNELAVAGRPSVLVPYPHAADDHQTANARAMADAGGAWLVPNERFDVATCRRTLEALLEDPAALSRMAAAARQIAMPDAAERLADLVEEVSCVRSVEDRT
ncbi:undecaprenyldiphospho-muramoylpentapeptide beta-N-acetylglucosaminyltransferase [Minwuia thermotolerans]|uniref:UDP-N-acetylglucosamine--N-acetylmuramyl-(pentapeptide) pyrophosphoryl-undecaprenol N-acetylglucosamine transferase n=1 Tax=Minwuia thermotolerans TaxID=2056226 RepID=A0A2M9G220_9PROT|nr:undecaprenyldiphospho-muramoylpentapeptide beta-N-acetylglucosaminyltransferase [Minwuia thermotolerans]PJK29768.1 undecaprenyldiphospho-muramoylpentapeptide beta-N-acetylglucosaminyltransferase [Minwuia thermotolerans]